MNRTDRLHALVVELRASHPEACSSSALADRFEVTTRTIERDILALQESGFAVQAQPGQRGSYRLDSAHSLPPLEFTPVEAAAIAAALARDDAGPLAHAGLTGQRKALAALSAVDAEATRRLVNRIRSSSAGSGSSTIPSRLESAVADQEVVSLRYRSDDGSVWTRLVEPVGLITRDKVWYLVGWCRQSEGHRSFRLDRVEDVEPTGEVAPKRELDDHLKELAPQLMQAHLFD